MIENSENIDFTNATIHTGVKFTAHIDMRLDARKLWINNDTVELFCGNRLVGKLTLDNDSAKLLLGVVTHIVNIGGRCKGINVKPYSHRSGK